MGMQNEEGCDLPCHTVLGQPADVSNVWPLAPSSLAVEPAPSDDPSEGVQQCACCVGIAVGGVQGMRMRS